MAHMMSERPSSIASHSAPQWGSTTHLDRPFTPQRGASVGFRDLVERTASRESLLELRRRTCVGRLEQLVAQSMQCPPELREALDVLRGDDESQGVAPLFRVLKEVVRLRMAVSELRVTRAQWQSLEAGMDRASADPVVAVALSSMSAQIKSIDADVEAHRARLAALRATLEAQTTTAAQTLWEETAGGCALAASVAMLDSSPAAMLRIGGGEVHAAPQPSYSAASRSRSRSAPLHETSAERELRIRSEAEAQLHERSVAVAQLCLALRLTLAEERKRAATTEEALRDEVRALTQRCAVLEAAGSAALVAASAPAVAPHASHVEALRKATSDATAAHAATAEAHAALARIEQAHGTLSSEAAAQQQKHALAVKQLELHVEDARRRGDEHEQRASEHEVSLAERDAAAERFRTKATALARQCAEACDRAEAFEAVAKTAREEQEALAAIAREEVAALIQENSARTAVLNALEVRCADLETRTEREGKELDALREEKLRLEREMVEAAKTADEAVTAADAAEANEALAYTSSQAMHRMMVGQTDKLRLSDKRHKDRDHHAERAEEAMAAMRKYCKGVEEKMQASHAANARDLQAAQKQLSELLDSETAYLRELDAAAATREQLQYQLKRSVEKGDALEGDFTRATAERDACLDELAAARLTAAQGDSALLKAHARLRTAESAIGADLAVAMRVLREE